jgi:UDPglucose 6-dehydrogenase
MVSNPEFLREGAAIEDFMKPDRIVVGCNSERARKIMRDLYGPLHKSGRPFVEMDIRSAELTKYAANAMLATRISFINEIANLCDRVGADVNLIAEGIGLDKRIGPYFLFPGIGYGGSCFPKDVRALINVARENGAKLRLIESVDEVNTLQRQIMVEKIVGYYGNGSLAGKTLAIWGLSFKPETDDIREAPSITIIEELLSRQAKVRAFDPVAIELAKKTIGGKIQYCSTNYECLKDADGLLIVTEWNEFRSPDFKRMKDLMKGHVIFDGRNIYNPSIVREHGFQYIGMGRNL